MKRMLKRRILLISFGYQDIIDETDVEGKDDIDKDIRILLIERMLKGRILLIRISEYY